MTASSASTSSTPADQYKYRMQHGYKANNPKKKHPTLSNTVYFNFEIYLTVI